MGRGIKILASVGVLLMLASCGGSDDGDTAAVTPTTGSDGGAEVLIGGDLELPDYFPADFYLPDGLTIKSVTRDPASGAISLLGTFESGDAAAIQQDVVAGLQAAGYELLSNDEIAAFVRNGVGRVRVHTSVFLDELTLSVDIDAWTDEQIDELRALFAEEVVVSGSATAEVGGDNLEAEGECTLKGPNRSFYATDVSITIQIDETQDPAYVYADVTLPDGRVFTLDATADAPYESSPQQLSVSGHAVEFNNEGAGSLPFAVTATCEG
jgi:hypothetical protein